MALTEQETKESKDLARNLKKRNDLLAELCAVQELIDQSIKILNKG